MFALILFIANLTVVLFPIDKNDWKLSLDKDDISVYTRKSESSKIHEFLAESTMEGSIEEFKKIIIDIKNYPNWLPDCQSAEIIEMPVETDITYHVKLKVPFPFENRDIVQQIVLQENKGLLEVFINNKSDRLNKERKYVRMTVAHGKWTIKALSDNKISIRFQYLADPGGEIPAWLVNSFVVKNPHLSLVNIRKLMAD